MKCFLLYSVAVIVAFLAIDSLAGNLISRSQLRRTTDPSERSARGEIILKKTTRGQQIMQVSVKGLGVDSFALFVSPFNSFTTDCCVSAVAPLARTSAKKGAWSRRITGTGAAPPSPHATGKVLVRYNGVQGRSTFDVRASKLTPGQVYHVFIADTTNLNTYVLVDAGTMTTSKSGSTARFLRDTRFADPMPQQVRDVADLSGRVIEIRDDFGRFVHLEGIIP